MNCLFYVKKNIFHIEIIYRHGCCCNIVIDYPHNYTDHNYFYILSQPNYLGTITPLKIRISICEII